MKKDSIIKISSGNKTTLARVVDISEDAVLVFRDTGNIWYPFDEYDIELLAVA